MFALIYRIKVCIVCVLQASTRVRSLTIHYRWPVRTISFSYDGQFLASASEDSYIDIVSTWKYVIVFCNSL